MARLTNKEKEVVFRAVAIFSDTYMDACDFSSDEAKDLESARLKLRMDVFGF